MTITVTITRISSELGAKCVCATKFLSITKAIDALVTYLVSRIDV